VIVDMRQHVAVKATRKDAVGSRRWRVYRFETRRRARRPGGRQLAISAKLLIFLGKMDTGPARDSCAHLARRPKFSVKYGVSGRIAAGQLRYSGYSSRLALTKRISPASLLLLCRYDLLWSSGDSNQGDSDG
jgi:hypothetical protein